MPHRKDIEGERGRFKSEGSGAETGDQKNSAKHFTQNGVFSQTLIRRTRYQDKGVGVAAGNSREESEDLRERRISSRVKRASRPELVSKPLERLVSA